MAIDPNILLAGRVADLGQAAQAGLGAASQFQAIQQQREAFPLAQQQREQAIASGDLRNEAAGINIQNAQQTQAINKAKALSGVLDTLEGITGPNSIAGRIKAFAGISEQLPQLGFTPDQIGQLQQDFDPSDQGLLEARQDLAPALALEQRASGGLASAKTEILEDGTVIQSLPNGQVDVRSPTGQVIPPGPERTAVIQRSQEFRESRLSGEADIAVSRAQRVAAATQRESRISNMKKDFGDRNRGAARGQVRLRQALRVAGRAEQGVTGSAKLQLAKLFPGIDVTDEALLDQTLGQLTIDELAKFKGPTTDFEFEKALKTVGAVGDSRSANIARLKGLERAGWFQQRESEQFNAHVKSGGDPDTWAFNFGEPVRTKKGVFTLQDLQDTAVDNNLTIEEVLQRLNK